MIRVGLAQTESSYGGATPPFHPAEAYPELAGLLGPTVRVAESEAGTAYAAVRAALAGVMQAFDRTELQP